MEDTKKLKFIDGLKGIACIFIFLDHSYYFSDKVWIAKYFGIFVEVFLAISGFALAYNYKERIEKISFLNFMKKRYFKIMPLYWITDIAFFVMLILAYAITKNNLIFAPIEDTSIQHFVLSFLGIGYILGEGKPINGVLWTIPFFLISYMLFYFVCKLRSKSENLYYMAIIWLLIISYVKSGSFIYYFAFTEGILLYEIYSKNAKLGKLISFLLLSTFFVIGAFVIVYNYKDLNFIIGNNKSNSAVIFLVPLLISCGIYIKPINRFFSSKICVFLGTISMSVYMWHMIPITIFEHNDTIKTVGTIYGLLFSLVSTIIIASISHYLLEPKLIALFNKILQSD